MNGIVLSEINFPNIIILLKNCGYDFLIIDCEHGGFDYREVYNIVNTAKLAGITAIVRIPEITRTTILKYLEMGADGLLVPMIENASQVKQVVEYVKYPPIGKRGSYLGKAQTNYITENPLQLMKNQNNKTKIWIQVELVKALENLDEIANTDGIDALVIGPCDLTADMNIFGEFENPRLLKALEDTHTACKNGNIDCGIITFNVPLLNKCKNMDIRCFGSEIEILKNGLESNYEKLF